MQLFYQSARQRNPFLAAISLLPQRTNLAVAFNPGYFIYHNGDVQNTGAVSVTPSDPQRSWLAKLVASGIIHSLMSDITLMLQAVARGERQASSDLLPLVYEELRQLAAARMARESAGQTLQPTALVHEAWLRLVGEGNRSWENRAHFFGAAAEAMRRILIENARRKSRLKRGGGQLRVDIDELELADTTPDDKILLIDEALERLKAEDPEKAKIVVLKFFGGLTNQEVALSLDVTERTVERQWAFAKAWMFRCIQTAL